MIRSTLLLLLLTATACAGDGGQNDAGGSDTTSAPGSTGSTGAAGSSSGTGLDVDALYDCVEPNLQEVRPLVGPGYDPGNGLLDPVQDTYIVSATMIMVRPGKENDFFAVATDVTQSLDAAEGMVAYGLAAEPTCGFQRTLSVYRSTEAMMSFVTSGAHATAIGRANELGITGKVTFWEMPAGDFPPTWTDAATQLAPITPFVGD